MKVLDSGHKYKLESYDGNIDIILQFVKRNNPPEKYPGNVNSYPGTIMQEVIRALIERCEYVNNQEFSLETDLVRSELIHCLYLLESRVRRKRNQSPLVIDVNQISYYTPCSECGHIVCLEHAS